MKLLCRNWLHSIRFDRLEIEFFIEDFSAEAWGSVPGRSGVER